MKKVHLISLILLLSVTVATSADVWHTETIGTVYNAIRGCDMALDSNDYPAVAYSAANSGINRFYWDGTEYVLRNVSSDSAFQSNELAMDLDVNDNMYVVTSSSDDNYLYCVWWDGSDWQEDCVYSYCAGAPGDIKVYNGEDARISFQRVPGSGDAGDLCLASQSSGSWAVSVLDTATSVGGYSKYAGAISHYDSPNHALKCYSSGSSRTVDDSDQYDGSASDIASWNSTYGIAYNGGTHPTYNLKYAEGSGSTWAIEVVEADCRPNEIAILGMHNAAHTYIAYADSSTYTAPILKFATRDGSGGSWSIETLATGGSGDYDFLDMELDSNNYPHMVYTCGNDIKHTWLSSDAAVESVDLSAKATDDGVLLSWAIVVDEPASVSVLRSVDENLPVVLSGELAGSETNWLDASVAAGVEYAYYLEVTELDGTVTRFGPSEVVVPSEVSELTLNDPYPNPASDALTVSYELSTASSVELSVYDLSGRLVQTLVAGEQTAGRQSVSWDSSEEATGVYLLRLEAAGEAITKRAVISR